CVLGRAISCGHETAEHTVGSNVFSEVSATHRASLTEDLHVSSFMSPARAPRAPVSLSGCSVTKCLDAIVPSYGLLPCGVSTPYVQPPLPPALRSGLPSLRSP